MDDHFKFEIINPEKVVFSDNPQMVSFPSYEGDMSVLKKILWVCDPLKFQSRLQKQE